MIAALLLAACTPLPTCAAVPVPPCASPTPTLGWDRVADGPGAVVAGYRLYSRPVGGTFALAATLPCWTDDDGSKRCRGVDIPYPVQRVTAVDLDAVEWTVRAYDTEGDASPADSNVVSVCMPHVWQKPEAYQ